MIKISTKNEYPFIPAFGNAEGHPVFTVYVKKLNDTIHAHLWADYKYNADKEIDMKIDPVKKVKAHIVRFENAPEIQIDGSATREMHIEDLFKYEALYPLVEELYLFLLDIKREVVDPLA